MPVTEHTVRQITAALAADPRLIAASLTPEHPTHGDAITLNTGRACQAACGMSVPPEDQA